MSVIHEFLEKIGGPLSPLQLRELATHMAAINIHIEERPKFGSSVNALTGEYSIGAERPNEIKMTEWKSEILGLMMHHICGPAMLEYANKAQILENIKTGKYSFLFNDKSEFAADHMDPC
jgi:hypothetical protein